MSKLTSRDAKTGRPTTTTSKTMEVHNPKTGGRLRLKPSQVEHFQHFVRVLMGHLQGLDTSVMGSGKTYIWNALAIHFGLPLFVVCPKIAKGKWEMVAQECGVSAFVISYQSLRSVKGKETIRELTHGLLTRVDIAGQKDAFMVTETYKAWVDQGCLLVLDEIQQIKNDSSQYRACRALTTSIQTHPQARSRIGLLSGSPFDKKEHVTNLLQLMGYIQNPKLFTWQSKLHNLRLLGAQELIDACTRLYGWERTAAVVHQEKLTKDNVIDLCFRLFIQVIKPTISAAMDSPQIDMERDVKDGYYRMEDEDRPKLIAAIKELSKAARFNRTDKTVGQKDIEWGGITKALQHIEQAKVPLLVRLAKQTLEANPKAKVIIFVSYINSLCELTTKLRDFYPMCLYGKITKDQRAAVMHYFQNDDRYRLLISNLRVGGACIDLHDTRGDSPRTTFIVPTYSILDLHQAAYRTYREGTKSVATIRHVYGRTSEQPEEDMVETSILRALAKKKDVLAEVLDRQVTEGVKFPGEYPVEYER